MNFDSEITCPALDGADPLTMLAALGLFTLGAGSGTLARMRWEWAGSWRPVFDAATDRDGLVALVVDSFLGSEVAELRQRAESESPNGNLPAPVRTLCERAVEARHPLVTRALHLDDVSKSGLSRSDFRELASVPAAAPYLHGVACDRELEGKKKTTIARTALSFANNNSGKQLLKDFKALAGMATARRADNALFGETPLHEPITGLGWDPASQRSYALQFSNPEKTVSCQPVQHALAFIGLACFPVLPVASGRSTSGVYSFPVSGRTGNATAESSVDDSGEQTAEHGGAGENPAGAREAEHLVWPLWSPPLSLDVVLALLALPDLASNAPKGAALKARGVSTVYRSRRIVMNKRSYLAPASPVI